MSLPYRVTGNPIKHSLSPRIHSHFAQVTGEPIEYTAQLEEAETFTDNLRRQLTSGEILGSNVTLPFKELAWALAEVRTARAETAGAANTLWLNDAGQICADNTDGIGLLTDLKNNLGLELENRRVLILGAGGAVRGVIQPMLDAGVAEVIIANRSVERAQAIVDIFPGAPLKAISYAEIKGPAFDLIVNGTSASIGGELPPVPDAAIDANTCGYDMMYGATKTPFCEWCEAHNARAIDGLGMLVEQAAESFFIWRGVKPETAASLAELRSELQP